MGRLSRGDASRRHLVERGQLAEGKKLLALSFRKHRDPPSASHYALSAIAIAEARQGNRDAALATLARARRLDPQCELLLRAESELTGPAATG